MSRVNSKRVLVVVAAGLAFGLWMRPLFKPGTVVQAAERNLQLSVEAASTNEAGIPVVSRAPDLSASLAAASSFADSTVQEGVAAEVSGNFGELGLDVDAMDPTRIQQYLSGLDAASTDAQRQMRLRLIEKWAGDQPMEAAAWSRSHFKGADRGEADAMIATRWFESDPVAAVAFAKSVEDPSSRGNALLTLGYEALRENPRQAVELVQEVPPSDSRNDFLVQAVQEWSAKEFDAVKTWVERFDEPALKDRLRSATAIGIAETDGQAAAVYAATSMDPGANQDRAVVSVLQRWVQSQPQEAVAWLEQFPDGDLKRIATKNLVPIWWQQDPKKASQWLDGLPPGQLRIWAEAAKASLAGSPAP